ncbi:hypothetical protein GCM10020000_18730 [Streptomyces olivoverticillatus]
MRWDDIDIVRRGTVLRSGGHGFAALGRHRLLEILHERCRSLGVTLRFTTEAPPAAELARTHDLVVAADGVHSRTRDAHADIFRPILTTHRCRYIWLAADFALDAFRFEIAETRHGVMQLHAYPYARPSPDHHPTTRPSGPHLPDGASTVIVEMREEVWRAAGLDRCGEQASIDLCGTVFDSLLGGRRLRSNRSAWTAFRTVVNERWCHGNTVLLGDAAHTAHFSIGSGTKLAVEDALALAARLQHTPSVPEALAAYEAQRRPSRRVHPARRQGQPRMVRGARGAPGPAAAPVRLLPPHPQPPRHPRQPVPARSGLRRGSRGRGGRAAGHAPPMFTPFRLRGLTLRNRVVVSPMDMYTAVDGTPGDFHLVHLGSRALGGAALVMTEMVCVSARGRITPGCTGLYAPEHERAWRRITGFVHERAPGTAIGVQLGHSGRKGSTRLMWEGIDEPLPHGNWPLAAASPLPYRPGVNQTPHALDAAEMAEIRAEFVRSAEAAARAGFDLLELHCAHGYLLSGFLSPLANHRTDAYGGSLAQPPRLPPGGLRRRAGRLARRPAHDGAYLRHGLGPRGHHGRRRGRHGAGLRRARGRCRRRVHRAGGSSRAARLRQVVPGAVRRADTARGGRAGHRGGRHIVVGRRELPDPGRADRPVRARTPAPVRPAVDAARGRRAGLHGPRCPVARAVPRGQPQTAHGPGV